MDKERLKELIKAEYSDGVLKCLWKLYDLKVIAEHNKKYKEYQDWREEQDLNKARQDCLANHDFYKHVDDYIPDSIFQALKRKKER